jgi:hypothetical protein
MWIMVGNVYSSFHDNGIPAFDDDIEWSVAEVK